MEKKQRYYTYFSIEFGKVYYLYLISKIGTLTCLEYIFFSYMQVTTSRDEADKNEQEFVDSINNLSKVKWLVEKEEELIDKLKKELVQSALSKKIKM